MSDKSSPAASLNQTASNNLPTQSGQPGAALHNQTRIMHPAYAAPDGFVALTTPIHHASTVVFPNLAAMRNHDWRDDHSYSYGLHGTPTTFALQHQLAMIEGAGDQRTQAVLAPSGLAAIAMINFALLKQGDDVLLPSSVYGPNREMGRGLLRDLGISVRFYDVNLGAGIANLLQPNTRLVWTESPGSISMEVQDIPAIVQAVRHFEQQGHGRIAVAIDNTWSAGLAFKPFAHGVDIAMQALTKYQSGGADVLMGAAITQDRHWLDKLKLAHMRLGIGVSPDDTYLVLRGLSSMRARFAMHDANARVIASWLRAQAPVKLLLHPAFADCPGHALWQRDFFSVDGKPQPAAAGLFSIVFQDSIIQAQADAFVEGLQLFKIGYSWGGPTSLALTYDMKAIRPEGWPHQGPLVRLNIGLENVDDVLADVQRSFVRVFNT